MTCTTKPHLPIHPLGYTLVGHGIGDSAHLATPLGLARAKNNRDWYASGRDGREGALGRGAGTGERQGGGMRNR